MSLSYAMRYLVLLTALLAVAVLGCTPAVETDLIGTWQITDGSRSHLPQQVREAAGRLTLAGDGTFSARELPVSVPRSTPGPWPADEVPGLLTGSGHWKLGRAGNQTIELSIERAAGLYPGDVPYGYSLFIYGGPRSYSLVDYWGDPDVVPRIYFARIGSLRAPIGTRPILGPSTQMQLASS